MQTIHHRDPKKIMKLSRLGSFHQSKLSFLRSFIREFKDWNFQTNLFELDKNGYGTLQMNLVQMRGLTELLQQNGTLPLFYMMVFLQVKILKD